MLDDPEYDEVYWCVVSLLVMSLSQPSGAGGEGRDQGPERHNKTSGHSGISNMKMIEHKGISTRVVESDQVIEEVSGISVGWH